MSDDADFAGVLIDRETEALIARRREALAPDLTGLPTARDCADCGRPIPAPRLAVLPGTARCVACASRREVTHVH